MRDAQTRDKHVLLRVTSICDLLEASISKYYIIFLYFLYLLPQIVHNPET